MSPSVLQAEHRYPQIPTTLKQLMKAGWQAKALKLICRQIKLGDSSLHLTLRRTGRRIL